MQRQAVVPDAITYGDLMHNLAATGHIAAGSRLLALAEDSGLLSQADRYQMTRALLEACRAVGDYDTAALVQAAEARLGLTASAPLASVLVQGFAGEEDYLDR